MIEPVIDRNDIQFVGLGLTENSFNDALQESDECQVVVLSWSELSDHVKLLSHETALGRMFADEGESQLPINR